MKLLFKRKHLLLLFIILVSAQFRTTNVKGQSERFPDLKAKGKVPSIINSPVYETYESSLEEEVEVSDSKVERKAKDNFVLQSSYAINSILTSGVIVFNDTISLYLEAITKHLLREHPEYSGKIQVFAYKSPVVNALATNNGVILVTTGLLARLNSEAELAYILSHEISHFIKKHPITAHVDEAILNTDRSFRRMNSDSQFKALASKSREQESEADEYAYNFFDLSGYSKSAPETSFEILKYANNLYEAEGNLSIKKFIYPAGKVPSDYFKNIPEVSIEETQEELLYSSHPGLNDRITKASEKRKDDNSGKDFIISESWFKHVKRVSRFTNIERLLALQMPDVAMEYLYLLAMEEGETPAVLYLKARTFYEYALVRNLENYRLIFSKKPGGSRIDANKIGKGESLVLAWSAADQYSKVSDGDPYPEKIKAHISAMLTEQSFKREDEQFAERAKELQKTHVPAEKKTNRDYSYLSYDLKEREKSRKEFFKEFKKESPIQKVILVDPSWQYFDTRKGIYLVNSEKESAEFRKSVKELSSDNGLEVIILSSFETGADDVQEFNDRLVLLDYLSNFSSEKPYYDQHKVDEILKRYGANHVSLLQIKSLLVKEDLIETISYAIISASFVFTPYGVYHLIKKEYDSYILFAIVDGFKGELEFLDYMEIPVKAKPMIYKGQLYNYFRLLTHKKRS